MAVKTVTWKMRQRQGTAAEWQARNPALDLGEFGYATDSGVLKIGDGSTAWNSLPAIAVYDTNGNLQSATPIEDDDVIRVSDLADLLLGGTFAAPLVTDSAVTIETDDGTVLQAALKI